MLATPKLAELVDAGRRRDWRLALVGDPLQLSAVGRGGMFGHLVDSHGAVELEPSTASPTTGNAMPASSCAPATPRPSTSTTRHGRLHGGTAPLSRTRSSPLGRAPRARDGRRAAPPPTRPPAASTTASKPHRLAAGELERHEAVAAIGRAAPRRRRRRDPPQRPHPPHRPGRDGQEPRPLDHRGHRARRRRRASPAATAPSDPPGRLRRRARRARLRRDHPRRPGPHRRPLVFLDGPIDAARSTSRSDPRPPHQRGLRRH